MTNTGPTASPIIFDALNTLEMRGSLLALVRPNNPPPGIAGFLLDVVGDDGAELESDITDNYTEANLAIQDHIALRPEIVTVTGEVAELVRSSPTTRPVVPAQNPLPLIPGLRPEFAPGATAQQARTAQVAAARIAAVVDTQSLYGYYNAHLPQQPTQTKQSLVYGYFYQLWLGRQLFSVETPWGFFTNMAILSLSSKQAAVSRSVTEFRITFKKIRVAKSIVIQPGQLTGRAVDQQAVVSQSGFIGQSSVTDVQASKFLVGMKAFPVP